MSEQIGFVKLTEPPALCVQYPTCSVCLVELENGSDGWACPNCGTQWDLGAGDGDRGTLFADYYGEEPTGPAVTTNEAALIAAYREAMDRHRRWGAKHPLLFPEPHRPRILDRES